MLLFENKITQNTQAFIAKVKSISGKLNINPDWLMAVMDLETGGTFSPSIRNGDTGATGLIQFLPSTAKGLGTTTEALKNMSNVQQLDYVYAYLNRQRQYLTDFISVYLAVFFPAALGKSDDFVIRTSGTSAGTIASQNSGFDLNKDMQIKVGEIKKAFLSRIPKNYIDRFVQGRDDLMKLARRNIVAISAVTVGLAIIIYLKLS